MTVSLDSNVPRTAAAAQSEAILKLGQSVGATISAQLRDLANVERTAMRTVNALELDGMATELELMAVAVPGVAVRLALTVSVASKPTADLAALPGDARSSTGQQPDPAAADPAAPVFSQPPDPEGRIHPVGTP